MTAKIKKFSGKSHADLYRDDAGNLWSKMKQGNVDHYEYQGTLQEYGITIK